KIDAPVAAGPVVLRQRRTLDADRHQAGGARSGRDFLRGDQMREKSRRALRLPATARDAPLPGGGADLRPLTEIRRRHRHQVVAETLAVLARLPRTGVVEQRAALLERLVVGGMAFNQLVLEQAGLGAGG